MKDNINNMDFAVYVIIGIMIFVLGLFIILNPSGIERWIGYFPIGLGFCFIFGGVLLFSMRDLKI
jgi:hypothetical protein